MTKCPLPGQSITLCLLTAPGLWLWGRGWGEREWEVTTGLLKVIMAAVDYRVSSPSLFLAGGQHATACMLISCGREREMREEGRRERIVWPGPWEEKPPDAAATEAAQAPRTLPLNRWRQEGLALVKWYDLAVFPSVFCVCVHSPGCSYLVV